MQTGRIKKALAGLAVATGSIVLAAGSASAFVRPVSSTYMAPVQHQMNPGWPTGPSIEVSPNGTNDVIVNGYGFVPNEKVEVWVGYNSNSANNPTGAFYYYPTAASNGAFQIDAWVGYCTGAAKTVTVQATGYSQDRSNQATTTLPAC